MALLDKTQNLDLYVSSVQKCSGTAEIYSCVTGSIGQSVINDCKDASDLFYNNYRLDNNPKKPLTFNELSRLAFSMNINTDTNAAEEIRWKTYFILKTWLTSPTSPAFIGCMLDAKKFVKKIEQLSLDSDKDKIILELDTYENLGNLLNLKVCNAYGKLDDKTSQDIDKAINIIITNPNKKYALPSLPTKYPNSQLSEKINAQTYWPYDLSSETGKKSCDYNKCAKAYIEQILSTSGTQDYSIHR